MKDNLDSSYAVAIFSLLKERKLLNECYEQIKSIQEIFKDENLNKFLNSYFVKNDDKYSLIDKIFKDFNPLLIDSIKLITRNHKIINIESILNNLVSLMNEEFNYLEGLIYSVELMEKSELEKIENALSKKYKSKVFLKNKVDESLIGGFKIIINNTSIDYSLSSSLNEMRNKLVG